MLAGEKICIMKNFGLWPNKYKVLTCKLLYIMQYFHTVH